MTKFGAFKRGRLVRRDIFKGAFRGTIMLTVCIRMNKVICY